MRAFEAFQGGGLRIQLCGPEATTEVHRLTQLAFAHYDKLDPPSGAVRETEEGVRGDLESGAAAIAWLDDRAVACVRFERESGYLHVRRLAVDPALQRQGIGTAVMHWLHDYARAAGYGEVRIGVRRQLPGNLRFYERLGYRAIADHRHPGYTEVTWIEMARAV